MGTNEQATIIAGIGYFVAIAGIDRWLVADPKAGWAVPQAGLGRRVLSFFGNFFSELVKLAPRFALVWFASLLFTESLLVFIFEPEVREQVKVVDIENKESFEVQFQQLYARRSEAVDNERKAAEANLITWQDRKRTNDALLKPLLERRTALIQSRAYFCEWCTDYTSTEAKDVNSQIAAVSADAPLGSERTQLEVAIERARLRLAKTDAVQHGSLPGNENVETIQSEVKKELSGKTPKSIEDGFLILKRGLGKLVDPDQSSNCRAIGTSSVGKTPDGATCIITYDANAARESQLWRIVLMILEVSAISVKFVRSILPKSGYATAMAAIDSEDALRGERRQLQAKAERDIFALQADDMVRVASEVSSTEREALMKEVGRQRLRYRIGEVGSRLKAASRPPASKGRKPIDEVAGVDQPEPLPTPRISRTDEAGSPNSHLYD